MDKIIEILEEIIKPINAKWKRFNETTCKILYHGYHSKSNFMGYLDIAINKNLVFNKSHVHRN